MITLNASGGSITFEFSGNSTYLNDGTITVPVNSLALIIDESDMVTFKKSQSSDIFVSANIAEFGMTKDELESWFKANAVGSTGGGVTPEEVEEMIDEAISGITVSGVTEEELNEAIASAKTEIEAEIPTVPTSNTAFTNDAGYVTSGYVDSSVSGYADSCLYDDNAKAVKFYHGGTGGTEVYSFDASPFLVDGMIDNVEIVDYQPTPPTIAQDKVKVTWADGYNQTYDVDYSGGIGDGSEHDYNNFTKIEFGNSTGIKTINQNFFATSDDCFSLTSATFVGDVKNMNGAPFASAFELNEVYFFADSPSGFTFEYSPVEDFMATVYDGCETYDTVPATYPIYVPSLASYQNTVLYNDGQDDVTWGEHFGSRLQEIPTVKALKIDFNTASGKEDIYITLTDIFDPSNYYDKTEIDAIVSGKADTTAVTEEISAAVSGKTNESDFSAHTANTIIHVTSSQTAYWDAKSNFSGSYNDLTDKPTIPTVPTSNTAFTNDAGYITEDALSGYAESSAVTEEISAAVSGKSDSSAVTEVSDALTAHTANTTVHITSAERTAWNAKSDFSGSYNDLTDKPTIPTVPTSNTAFTNDAGYITSGEAQSQIDNSISGKADTATTYTKTETDNAITAATSTKQDTLVSSVNIKTINNESLLGSGNIDIQGGGGSGVSVVELTQAEYDELPSSAKTDTSKMYVITDAQAVDISQYWTSAQTQSAITQATSGKVDSSSVVTAVTSASTDNEIPTAKAVFDAIPTGGTGGGKAVSAGTNISVATGETADTINCTLPITADTRHNYNFISNSTTITGNNSENAIFGTNNHLNCSGALIIGGSNYVYGNGCFICGYNNEARKLRNSLFGDRLKSTNSYEFGFGQYNNSVSASTTWGDSGNTLFSIGNGTADNVRHNAFEIRQNGDIYLSYNGNDIKLQDLIADIYSKLPTS